MNKQLVFIALLAIIVAADPRPPVWPEQWQQDYTDKWHMDGEYEISQAKYIYDWTNNRQNVWREDCRADSISATFLDRKVACSQIVTGGVRYVYVEDDDSCCFCCDAQHGCGLLRPNWTSLSHEIWEGYKFIDGVFYNVFKNFDGPDPIYTLYNAETDVQAYIYRPGNKELIIWDQNSFQSFISKDYKKMLDLPQKCKASNLPRCGGKCDKLQPPPTSDEQ